MKISHELPKSLLSLGLLYNDYDYLLPKFYLEDEKYREYFKSSRKNNRYIMMDNGLFEGDIPSDQTLLDIIEEISPDIFITPDAWDNLDETIDNLKKWKSLVPDYTDIMCVFQGSELEHVYRFLEEMKSHDIEYIAFNHGSKLYENLIKDPSIDRVRSLGRRVLMEKLFNNGDLDGFKVHLLGCTQPQEFSFYKKFNIPISSIDTSNPILAALEGYKYDELYGLENKPKSRMEDFYWEENLKSKFPDVIFNIKVFKKLLV